MRIGMMDGTFGLAVKVAQHMGWFAQAGLEKPETCRVDDETSLMRELESGAVSLGRVSAERTLQARRAGSAVRIVAGFDNTMVHVLVGARGITCAEQLVGRKVGYNTPGDYTQSFIVAALKHLGLSPEQVQLVSCGKSETRRELLRAGEISATIVSQKPAQKLQEEGFPWIAEMADVFPEYQNKVLVASQACLETEPVELSAALAGIIQAYRYLDGEPSNEVLSATLAEAEWVGESVDLGEQLAVRRKRHPADDGMPSVKGLLMVALENFPDSPADAREQLVHDALALGPLKQAQAKLRLA